MAELVDKPSWFATLVALALFVGLMLAAPGYAGARSAPNTHRRHDLSRRQSPPVPYHAALLEDADTGRILFQKNSEMEWPPASMAKMMLLLIAAEKIKGGQFSLESPVRISSLAAHTGGSHVDLQEGRTYPLGQLMKAALIQSANDAAVAVAQKIAGSVDAAVRMMNAEARQLGMTHTEYHTVDGLPPSTDHDVDRTDARDLATLARALIHRTDLLRWSGMEQVPFDGGLCMLHNTNLLVGRFPGCDGLKTGFTFEAGFNVTATARRGDMRLIAVILGAPSNRERFVQAAKLLQWGFDNFMALTVLKRGQALPVRVQVESGPVIHPIVAHNLKVVIPKDGAMSLHFRYRLPSAVDAPLQSGERLGEVLVRDRGETVGSVAALSPVEVPLKPAGESSDDASPAAQARSSQ